MSWLERVTKRKDMVRSDIREIVSTYGSMFLQSVSSVTPSQLDAAIMEMLNIQNDGTGLQLACQGFHIYTLFGHGEAESRLRPLHC